MQLKQVDDHRIFIKDVKPHRKPCAHTVLITNLLCRKNYDDGSLLKSIKLGQVFGRIKPGRLCNHFGRKADRKENSSMAT